eukprot:CAMPEP_0181363406 /NCGR_PEP_ID=MMETSP1106-20121128/8706_1 /TAXON_ID=81844 /ORGANISM="Mantoniella antarctica, Strain SL-175" /LENGTH=62 /DNA_ID=CAMNT_0023477791 /DNA_START=46 /DNA_END=231 /DNA_ORIENTATION=-
MTRGEVDGGHAVDVLLVLLAPERCKQLGGIVGAVIHRGKQRVPAILVDGLDVHLLAELLDGW